MLSFLIGRHSTLSGRKDINDLVHWARRFSDFCEAVTADRVEPAQLSGFIGLEGQEKGAVGMAALMVLPHGVLPAGIWPSERSLGVS